MEKLDLPEDDYIFDENVRKINKTDRVHADVVNPILSALFKNSIWGRRNYVTKKQLGIPEGQNPSVENQVPIIPEAPNEREEFIAGDNIGIILSKVKKFFMDLKTVAFTGEYKDLLGKPTIPTVPGAIKNPYAIKANGKSYDGSTATDVGIMGLGYGGTGATNAAGARSNLGLGVVATYGVANNLTTTQPGFALEAIQGKNLKEQLDEVNSNLGGVKLVSEGSGTNAKYYAQIGADTSSKKPLGSPAILEVNVGGFTVHAGNNNTMSIAEGVGTVLNFTAFKNLGYNFVQISPWVGSVLQYNIASGSKVSLETVENLSYSGLIYTKEVFLSVPTVVLTFSK